MGKLTDLTIEGFRRRFEAGDPKALLEALDLFCRSGDKMPLWMREALIARLDPFLRYEIKSLDQAFDVERKRERISSRKMRLALQPAVAWEVITLHREENLPIDNALFERVGKKFNISMGTARDFYYNDNPARKLFEAMPTEPPATSKLSGR
ncbi:hypothetical protein BjapCC829_24765 [Bradyrhizobium barranii]|uniref:Uncharacterized protein n=1 Tax=Bradyrhizobium barranii TaxID=2992140 RepID=A0ABY3QBI0_9BRAD|nr:hypothetical protein [Bradyrhizobium japonicum]UFW83190.1 hypothetical protein BjapCC829_24765 [Bradyrhizobium japonicum]